MEDNAIVVNHRHHTGHPHPITNHTTSDCTNDTYVSTIYQILVPSLFAPIVLLGVVGNLLVIYVILSRRRLQTVTNLLLLSLAFSDLCFLALCGSFAVIHYVQTVWPLGPVFCSLIQYLLYVTCYVSMYTLVAVSVVRYITVVYGTDACFVKHKVNVIILIVLIWTVFLLAKIPILMVHSVSYNPNTERMECIISGKLDGRNLFATFFIFAYALPLSVIATLYLLIVRHLRLNSPRQIGAQAEDRQSHVIRVLVLLVLTFAVCWLPLHLHLLVAYYGSIPESVTYKVLLIFWHCLIYINSMLNPLIYNCFSKDFRNAFRDTIVCCAKVPEITQV